MAKVHAQILVCMEIDASNVHSVHADLEDISGQIQRAIGDRENLPYSGCKVRITEVYSPTKGWEIEAQLRANEAF